MVFWEAVNPGADESAVFSEYAGIWRAAEKIVYSRSLQTVSSARTRIEREFDPDAVRRLKQSAATDITVGGAELAGHALVERLVDECHLFCARLWSEAASAPCQKTCARNWNFLDQRGFRNGVVHLHYRVNV